MPNVFYKAFVLLDYVSLCHFLFKVMVFMSLGTLNHAVRRHLLPCTARTVQLMEDWRSQRQVAIRFEVSKSVISSVGARLRYTGRYNRRLGNDNRHVTASLKTVILVWLHFALAPLLRDRSKWTIDGAIVCIYPIQMTRNRLHELTCEQKGHLYIPFWLRYTSGPTWRKPVQGTDGPTLPRRGHRRCDP